MSVAGPDRLALGSRVRQRTDARAPGGTRHHRGNCPEGDAGTAAGGEKDERNVDEEVENDDEEYEEDDEDEIYEGYQEYEPDEEERALVTDWANRADEDDEAEEWEWRHR